MAKYAGVDLSAWQTGVDYKALSKARIQGKPLKFAMLRLGYGRSKDKLFDKHYKGCKAAGIKVGVYVWSRAENVAEARAEANWALDQIKALDIDYPIAMDFEDTNVLSKGLSREQYSAIVRAFLGSIKAANYYPILYTGKYTLQDHLDGKLLSEYDLWLAQYTKQGYQSQLGQTMWQFTVAGHPSWDYSQQLSVDGVKGQCDCDWSYVGYAAKIKKLGMNQPLVEVSAKVSLPKAKAEEMASKLKAMGCSVYIK